MLTGTGTRVRFEGLTVVIGAISFLHYITKTITITIPTITTKLSRQGIGISFL